ncbi:(pine wood nematode) hypothetical protein [Aphelenchoides besseyi]|nr:(pine wood nematode) hypothetical protein [Aphelenchoides besseyi]KAI6195212.1 (pine wood nematode) hypothetical protein [Aphelenchoides besseyi]
MIGIFLISLLVLFLVHQFYYRKRNLPKGPIAWPLVGSALELMKLERWEYKFLEWTNKYGKIHTYFLGNMPIVAINDYDTMIELFVKNGDDFTERAPSELLDKEVRESSGELWRSQRRFALKVFRDFGLNKQKMQERVLEELQTICGNIDEEIKSNQEIDFHKHTDIATGSLINAILCGFRFTTNGQEKLFYRLKELLEKIMLSFASPILMLAMMNEFMSKLPIFRSRFRACVELNLEIRNFIEKCVDEHLASTDYSADEFEPRDFIDAFLFEQKKEAKGEPTYFTFAGQETTSTTLTWGFAYLIRHPEAQQKLHAELDRVIGSDRLITMSDKNDLPYTNAVINEIQRCSNIIGQNLLRRTGRDMNIGGYAVPKGTIIIPQISVPMVDPKIFPEPRKFNPDRFIDENGKLKRCEELMPFSLGKRQCLGESLARTELFLFIANLCNLYKFLPGDKPPSLNKTTTGFSFATQPYKCRLEKRY